MEWTVVIPAKALPEAKSRLAAMSDGPEQHRLLVEAIRSDTIAAARAARGVARVIVVVDRPGADADVLVQTSPGLDAAVSDAAAYSTQRWPADGVAALVGDLPALQPAELAEALRAAAGHHRAFVPDAAGTGTTLLAATPGHPLRPQFGLGSAARHQVHAAAIEAGPGLRNDVDDAADLHAAAALGLGDATAAALGEAGVIVCSACSGIMGG